MINTARIHSKTVKYALISDVHGNLPAFIAVLDDAKAHGADHILLLGDYIIDLPWPNEVAETIIGLKNAVVIRGNKEGYLINMQSQEQADWVYDQMMPLYWTYKELTADNMNFFISLPERAEIKTSGGSIFLSHSSSIFYRKPKIKPFHSSEYQLEMLRRPFTHEDYLRFSRKALQENTEAMAEISKLRDGIYAFGHNHLQWHMRIGRKLFVNPGSCGMPLGCNPKAAYTMLEYGSEGWNVTEHRVWYDTRATAYELMNSGLYASAEIWSRIAIKQLYTGCEYISGFLRYAKALAQERNLPEDPVCNEIWRDAANSYRVFDVYEDIF